MSSTSASTSAAEGSRRPAWARAFQRLAASPRIVKAVVRCEEQAPAASVPAPADATSPIGEAATGPKEDPPVNFEMFNREWMQMSQQDNWDGFRIETSTPINKFLAASHTLFLGTQMRESGYIYQFGPTFQTEGARTAMITRVGLDGGVNGRLVQKIGNAFEVKASSQSHLKDPQRNMHDASVEYTGKDWTLGAKAAWQGALLGGCSFSQRISQFHFGGDVTAVAVNNIVIIAQGGARYANGKDTVAISLNRQPDPKSPVGANVHECKLSYTRRFSERLALGTEYKYSHPDKDSGLSMAYEYNFRNAHVQGLLDTDGKVSCSVFDAQGMGFSGMIDYFRGDYKFGVMMQVLPQEQGQQPM